MTDTDEHRCPNCGSTELVSINTAAFDDELLECPSCKRLYAVKLKADGSGWLMAV
jgi:RNA polymerase subunit RPABC4/transcription elongation factor Spt4